MTKTAKTAGALEEVDANAKLIDVNRSKIGGFLKYFSQRVEHFRELFGREYSESEAKTAFREINPGL